MAEFQGRHPLNVPGKYYVGSDCLDCDACRATAPDLFQRDESRGASYVFRQPVTPEEMALAEECAAGCCVESIGNDGDLFDWDTHPIDPWPEFDPEELQRRSDWSCCDHVEKRQNVSYPPPALPPKRPWWKFW